MVHPPPCRACSIRRNVADQDFLKPPWLHADFILHDILIAAAQHLPSQFLPIILFNILQFSARVVLKVISVYPFRYSCIASLGCFEISPGVLLSRSAHRWRQRKYGRHETLNCMGCLCLGLHIVSLSFRIPRMASSLPFPLSSLSLGCECNWWDCWAMRRMSISVMLPRGVTTGYCEDIGMMRDAASLDFAITTHRLP